MNIRHILLAILAVAAVFIRPAAAAEIDVSKAITIGSGPKTVVEFTDPDCPFCRKASKYFEGRRDSGTAEYGPIKGHAGPGG